MINQSYSFILTLELEPLKQRESAYREHLETKERRWARWQRRRLKLRLVKQQTRRNAWRLVPAIALTLGSLLIANALWPILSYFIFTSPALQSTQLVSALPSVSVIHQGPGQPTTAQAATADLLSPRVIEDNLDYTNLNNWFPTVPTTTEPEEVVEYSLSIPAIGVEDARVKIGGTDLNNSLIQYPGTADPGQLGAPVIFGHSVLRQFYNPSIKNSRRYYSIFSKIMTLKQGDEIILDYDGIRYVYTVVKKTEVKPEDTYILEQEYNVRQLKLITCVPEGTYLRRGVVLAQLQEVH